MITVGDIRQAIQDLPNDSPVLIDFKTHWGEFERLLSQATGCHDGRYGPALYLSIGDYAETWEERNARAERDQACVVQDTNENESSIEVKSYMG